MPSVSVHFDPNETTIHAGYSNFAEALVAVIEACLGAQRDKVQIMAVPLAHPPIGRTVYIEIKARANEHRTEAVLADFVQRVDALSRAELGTPCRIRYFGYPGSFLAAAN
ncbi:MAG: hypothetical protein HOH04_16200 [Rhodospirillaceae bacterium]|nr:hypothetical protein [Rhodospirillaceae bacterium]